VKFPFQRFLSERKAVLNSMDRRRIYVENVRAFLGVNRRAAEWLCEKACRDGLLEHWVALENPERGRTLLEFRQGEEPPVDEVIDEVAEQLGEQSRFHVTDLRRVDFYRGSK
jgi:hypothetical protein